MSTIKTLRNLSEAATYFARYADLAARSSNDANNAPVERMGELDAKALGNVLIASGYFTKLKFMLLVTLIKHTNAASAEFRNAVEKKDWKRAQNAVLTIAKMARLAETLRNHSKSDIRVAKEFTNVSNKQSQQLKKVAENANDKIKNIIDKITKQLQEQQRQLKKAQSSMTK